LLKVASEEEASPGSLMMCTTSSSALQVLLAQVDHVLLEWPEVGVTEGFDAARAQWLGGIQQLVLTLRVRTIAQTLSWIVL
jgi:hypothetical protein